MGLLNFFADRNYEYDFRFFWFSSMYLWRWEMKYFETMLQSCEIHFSQYALRRVITKIVYRAGISIYINKLIHLYTLVCRYFLYSLCSPVGVSSAGTAVVFCLRKSGIPPPFFGARLGHMVGCTVLMQSAWALALQARHLKPWRLWPRNTWPQASHGVIFRYVYSRHWWPPSDSRLFL